ncbi:hypothetical protein O181_000783 [Austropuccinia psidii MF-1]|uniref:CCHC-type domain-containing protein n=1 Tax=Austropuccinia psidii MF-1 TaxID=1389203 RepID=A0A9Q3B9H1_9BASI|nr:hypothetical protein [Austropuccinia psidii MF-1]
MKAQPQFHSLDNQYQEDIKPDVFLDNKPRSPSQYQDGYIMTYSEKEALKQLPEATICPKFFGVGEYDHMELIDYIDELFFIYVPGIPDYCVTTRLNTVFIVQAIFWHTEMKGSYCRGKWTWWKSQIIQKYCHGAWIWQKTMSFENDKYSVDKDPYELCLGQSKKLKAIDPQMNIQIRNHKLFTQIPGEIEHAIKCRCNQSLTLDDIFNTLQNGRKRSNIGKYPPYKSSSFKGKKPFRMNIRDETKERVADVTKKKSSCHNCGSTDQYANNCPKAKKKVYAIEKVPEE